MKWTPEQVKGKTPEQLVAMQMEDWLFDDPALMESYKPEKVADCLEWVADKVRMNTEHAGVAVCCHEEVFRMARDYFVDGHANDAAKAEEKVKAWNANQRKRRGEADVHPHPADPTAKPADDAQVSLFGEGS